MHVVIYEPSSGETLVSRELAGDEMLDETVYAAEYAEMIGMEVDDSARYYVPSCCGDIRVEFREDPANDVHIWSGQSFFLASLED